MTNLDEVEQSFLIEGLEDVVGLWQFVNASRRRRPDAAADTVREEVLGRVQRLMEKGLMEPGNLISSGTFEPWGLSVGDSLSRIEREWSGLGREPTIADICWFGNTDAGDRAGHEFLRAKRRQ